MPSPIPPTNPYPSTTSQYCRVATPSADSRNPEEKQDIETNIAHRGPLRSTSVPPKAADRPSMTMPSWKGRALCVPDSWSADSSGGLNTLHAYACPIARWTESAAGGTSHRLQPGSATMRERSRNLVATCHAYHIPYAVLELVTASGQKSA